MSNRRSAKYISTLVYMNEPQLLLLRAHRTNVVALAIPAGKGKAEFIAASISKKNWERYIDGTVDLRYLFVYAENNMYRFDLMNMKEDRITLLPWEGDVEDKYLPGPRFFSRNHTEEDVETTEDAYGVQSLLVDGQWDMPDFGEFYSRYADTYYFISSANEINDKTVSGESRKHIMDAFRDKAFRGGFSYVHFYQALASHRTRKERINIDEITYASPGHISIHGDDATFGETKNLISQFLDNRENTKKLYHNMHRYMSKARLLTMSGKEFQGENAFSKRLKTDAFTLGDLIGVPNQEAIAGVVEQNMLVFAKVIMSFYRRLDETSKFFAQGRMAFGE